jgi:hypothetical protein
MNEFTIDFQFKPKLYALLILHRCHVPELWAWAEPTRQKQRGDQMNESFFLRQRGDQMNESFFKAKRGPNEWMNFWDKFSDFLTQNADNFLFFLV